MTLVIAAPSVLSLTLVTVWLKELGPCLTRRAWQGLDERQREMLMGEVRGCPTGMSELSDGEYSAVMHGERGEEIRTREVLGRLNLQGKGIKWLKANFQ